MTDARLGGGQAGWSAGRLGSRAVGSKYGIVAHNPPEHHELSMSSGHQLSHAGGSQNSHPSAEGELLEIKIYTHIRMKHFQFLLCFLCLKLLAKEQANHLWIRKKFSFFITAETLSQVWEQGQCKSLKRLVYCGHEIPLCWESPSFNPSPC